MHTKNVLIGQSPVRTIHDENLTSLVVCDVLNNLYMRLRTNDTIVLLIKIIKQQVNGEEHGHILATSRLFLPIKFFNNV